MSAYPRPLRPQTSIEMAQALGAFWLVYDYAHERAAHMRVLRVQAATWTALDDRPSSSLSFIDGGTYTATMIADEAFAQAEYAFSFYRGFTETVRREIARTEYEEFGLADE